MKLFLISQIVNIDYDTYDAAVVAAPDEETARQTDPSPSEHPVDWQNNSNWVNFPELVIVRYLGEAADGVEQGVVCASFNAG